VAEVWRGTWDELLDRLGELGRSQCVYFGSGPHRGDEPCLVCDEDELGPEADVHPAADSAGLRTGLLADDVRGVVSYLRRVLGREPDRATVLLGIAHYADRDAYPDPASLPA
jgi:hypothetical protein